MSAVAGNGAYYRFRSRARYLQARGDLLGWYLGPGGRSGGRSGEDGGDAARLTAELAPDSPLLAALGAMPEADRPQDLEEALRYLRICLHLAEQEWPPAESFETTLASARSFEPGPVVPPVIEPAPAEPAPAQVMTPAEVRTPRVRRRRFRLLRGLLVLVLLVAVLWGGGRAAQTGIERLMIADNLNDSLPELAVSLSGLSLSLPAQASACIGAGPGRCRMDARGPAFGERLRTDLVQAQDATSRMLADLAPLTHSEDAALWFIAAAGQNCALEVQDALETDRRLVAGLCRIRERLTEYDLCLSGHPAITDRQCADLMRLAIADTLFDCTDCADRPANVFDPRIEWSSEIEDAAGLVRQGQRFAAPDRIGQVTWLRLTQDAEWLRQSAERWRAATFR